MHSVTPEVMAKVARLLGGSDLKSITFDDGFTEWRMVGGDRSYSYLSDGDLLLAILNKARELRHAPEVIASNGGAWAPWSSCMDGRLSYRGNTPLEAAILAFAQLETTHAA